MKLQTLVLGASPNPERYSYQACVSLLKHGHNVIPFGKRNGYIYGIEILSDETSIYNIHTITIYLNPINQKEYYGFIINLKPKRIIFNPGAENPELEYLADKAGIQVEEACTLVMLATNSYL